MIREKLLIVAKTKMKSEYRGSKHVCIGAMSKESNFRLMNKSGFNFTENDQIEIGDLWEATIQRKPELQPPHTEDVMVEHYHLVKSSVDPKPKIEKYRSPKIESLREQFEHKLGATKKGSLFIAKSNGIPDFSVTFWKNDEDLFLMSTNKGSYYRYDRSNLRIRFVGFQEPLLKIPRHSLIRLSLARWWAPEPDEGGLEPEQRCYLQLSGFFV